MSEYEKLAEKVGAWFSSKCDNRTRINLLLGLLINIGIAAQKILQARICPHERSQSAEAFIHAIAGTLISLADYDALTRQNAWKEEPYESELYVEPHDRPATRTIADRRTAVLLLAAAHEAGDLLISNSASKVLEPLLCIGDVLGVDMVEEAERQFEVLVREIE